MKILMVIPYFIPAWSYGGPVKVAYDYSKELYKRGHQITVVTTDTLNGKERIKKLVEKIENIEIIRFKNLSNTVAKKYNAYMPLMFPLWLIKNLKKFDVVYCHDLFTIQNLWVGIFASIYKKPFILQPHGAFAPIRQSSRFLLLKKLYMAIYYPLLLNSKKIIALTNYEKKDLLKSFPKLKKRIIVIPNGIIPLIPTKFNIHQKYSIPNKNKIIGFIGRIQYIKGLDISLKILSKIKNKLNFTFLIMGPDEGEKSNLNKLAKKLGVYDQIIFTGLLEGQDKINTMAGCDMFLFTSRNEGLPMTILEAASLGVPQVISDKCHVPEIQQHNAGYVIGLKKINKFSEKISDLLQNQVNHKLMSKNAKQLVLSKFHIRKTINVIETTLSQ